MFQTGFYLRFNTILLSRLTLGFMPDLGFRVLCFGNKSLHPQMHETLALRSLNCTSPGSTPGAAQGLHVGGGLVIELSLRGGHGMIFLGTDW